MERIMKNSKSSINLVELFPYGAFPVAGFREIASYDAQNAVASLTSNEVEQAIFWFEGEEAEVA
jgi:hypothetical protein